MAPALRLCALALALLPAAVAAQEVAGDCRQYTNRSCEECLKNVTCLWCASSRRCMEYPVRRILPPADLCELRSARWGVCWVNFEALIIAMSVVGGTLLIMLGVCCCCCCCKKKSKKQVLGGSPDCGVAQMQPCAAAELSAECTEGFFCLPGQTRMMREQPGNGRRGGCGRRRGEQR
uniref:PTTG1 interacting protein n=1 Tax=Geospiza parvula TaxID=87175 RepID=A0A8C3NCN3_GEOPR